MKPIRAFIVCARLNNKVVPMIFKEPNGAKTIYETKEEAIKDWDGWGFIADLVEVEIRPLKKKKS